MNQPVSIYDIGHLSPEDRARRAQALLTDALLVNAFHAVEQAAWEEVKTSAPHDTQVREQAYFRVQALEALVGELQSHVNNLQVEQRRKKA